MEGFHGHLSDAEQRDPQFAMRVAFIPKLASKASNSDLAVEFVKLTPEQAAEMESIFFKEVERPKYRASQVVAKMRERGFTKFNLSHHTALWHELDGRNPGKGYGVTILGNQWCWYDSWIAVVIDYCERNASWLK